MKAYSSREKLKGDTKMLKRDFRKDGYTVRAGVEVVCNNQQGQEFHVYKEIADCFHYQGSVFVSNPTREKVITQFLLSEF